MKNNRPLHSLLTGIAVGVTAVALAGQALALSCLPGSAQSSFNQYDQAPENYYIFQGRFQAIEPLPLNNVVPRPTVNFRFVGRGLGPSGLEQRQSFIVPVTPQCLGPWCGGYPDTQRKIVFLKFESGRYHFEPTACPGASLEANQDNRRAIIDCFAGNCFDPNSPVPPAPPAPPVPPAPPAGQSSCGKELLSDFLGRRVGRLPAFVRQSPKVRIIRPGQPVTLDYLTDRLNIELNDRNRIIDLRCG